MQTRDSEHPQHPTGPGGLLATTPVLTRRGEIRAADLAAGDHLITRSGGFSEVLETRWAISRRPAISIKAGSLGHTRPGCDLILPSDQRILVRDWRAQALFSRHEALTEASRLVDGEFIRDLGEQDLGLVFLSLARSEVIYAGGLELECPLPAAAVQRSAA